MHGIGPRFAVWLTVEEADEILMRCLASEGEDSELFAAALSRIADAVREAVREAATDSIKLAA
jgi:hypothetical protein